MVMVGTLPQKFGHGGRCRRERGNSSESAVSAARSENVSDTGAAGAFGVEVKRAALRARALEPPSARQRSLQNTSAAPIIR
eukprot:3198695-Pyramimonas_sp.AAC.1